MKTIFVVIAIVAATFFFSNSVMAGEITGKVLYKDGSPCSGCKVSASINSGGVTDAVYCNSSGKFRLKWSSNNWIAKLFVNGNTVGRDIRPREYVEIKVK